MAKKGIEEMISEIEIFIDNCKYQPLSSSKIVVPKDDLEQMLNELKLKLPDEIERCKRSCVIKKLSLQMQEQEQILLSQNLLRRQISW